MVTSPTTLCLWRVMQRECCYSVDAVRSARETRLHSGTRSRMLSAIGATTKAYSQPTSGITATSLNAREVFLPGVTLHRRCSSSREQYVDANSSSK